MTAPSLPSPASVQQELLSKTPPPVAAASCGGMSTKTSVRWGDNAKFVQIDVNFNIEDREQHDTSANLFEYCKSVCKMS